MPQVPRSPSHGRGGSVPSPSDVRALQRLLCVGGATYLAWWFVVQAMVPGAYNPLGSRLAVVAFFLAVVFASFVSAPVRRHMREAFSACAWLLTLHFYFLLDRNQGDMAWAVGASVVMVAVGACLTSRRALLAYTALTLVLALLAAIANRVLLHSIFLPGLVTMAFLSNLTLHNRLLLERERGERVRVEAARALAETGVALRDEFISVASHELRTPLSALVLSVQGLARALQRADKPLNREALDRAAGMCIRQTTRLTRLVDRLLDASQITSGHLALELEALSLIDLARDVAQTFEADATLCGSSLEVAGSSAVHGQWDRTRLEQVVSNLLRNALTFGRGRPIRLTVSEDGPSARIAVSDEGIGIPREDQKRIFGRFERAVSAKNYGGMGLGLYVVSRIVEAHGGHVRVESEPGRGATFIVDLPRDEAATSSSPPPPA